MQTTTIEGVKGYLEAVSMMRKQCYTHPDLKFSSIEDFVLTHGKSFPEKMSKPKWVKQGVIKECFSNCFKEVCKNPSKLIYCEGYATGVIPVHHAWLVYDNKVIDPTWHGRDIIQDHTEYFGIPFRYEYVLKVALESGYYGILDNWSQNFPLLRGEHSPEDFLVN